MLFVVKIPVEEEQCSVNHLNLFEMARILGNRKLLLCMFWQIMEEAAGRIMICNPNWMEGIAVKMTNGATGLKILFALSSGVYRASG